MNNLYESYNYDVSYRATWNYENIVKVFTDKDYIKVNAPISFDIDEKNETSFNYFATSIISGIIYSIVSKAKEEKLDIQDIEGKIKLTLKNPLTLLEVKGYYEKPKIENIEVTIYFYLELFDNELDEFLKRSIDNCFIYNTLKDAIDIKLNFKQVF